MGPKILYTSFLGFEKREWDRQVSFLRFRHRHTVLSSDDRLWFEYHLLYAVRRIMDSPRILFIGVHRYTAWYPSLFPAGTFTTMDSNREQSVHGAPANHIVASATCLSEHFSSDHFDVVICNGVYGWGLDSSEDMALFARGLRTILKPGGLFVFGFNAPHDPINIRVCSKMVFRNLDRVSFIGTDIRVFNNYQHHSFIFFRKPERPRKG